MRTPYLPLRRTLLVLATGLLAVAADMAFERLARRVR